MRRFMTFRRLIFRESAPPVEAEKNPIAEEVLAASGDYIQIRDYSLVLSSQEIEHRLVHNPIGPFEIFVPPALLEKALTRNDESCLLYEQIHQCDLLIIDDLGTERNTDFVVSQLFVCLNDRILNRKSTIISTNLTLKNFSDTYSERTFSRIASNYQMISLIGKDIRIQKIFLGGN